MRNSIIFILLSTIFLMWSCGGEKNADTKSLIAKGDRYYGGTFRLNESEYIKTLFPPSILDASSYRTATQVYEGLYKFDQETLHLKDGLADGQPEISEDRMVYTIKIKKGVNFHNNECFDGGKGRELTAYDVKYCFDFLCEANPDNKNAPNFKSLFVGGEDYFEATANGRTPEGGVKGITVVDDYTISFKLTSPFSIFTYFLARPAAFIYPREAYELHGKKMHSSIAVGTGPFKLKELDEDIKIILIKNENYTHTKDQFENQLPFLDGLEISFIKEQNVVYRSFIQGDLDMVYRLPTENIIDILEKHRESGKSGTIKSQLNPEMGTNFLAFNTEDGPFANKDLRKAFNFAIDKVLLLEYVLQGAGAAPGQYGITPPTFDNYDIKNIKGYKYNKDSAQYYFKKSGSTSTSLKGITLDYSSVGGVMGLVVENVQKQIKENLGVAIEISPLSRAASIDKMRTGQSSFFRLGWMAEYPHPEIFASFFYGPNSKQYTRFSSAAFDKLYLEALSATNQEEAFAKFIEAENIAMDESPIIPLWYDEQYRLLQPYVENFPNNEMQYRDFSDVYLIPLDNLEASK